MPSFLYRSDTHVPGNGSEAESGDGFHVLDGGALVLGAAVASVHLREIIRDDMSLFGWALLWCTFGLVALTATGPFLLVVRRCFRPVTGYPRVGDCLWAVLGLPWLVSALARSALGDGPSSYDGAMALGLMVGLGAASLFALVVIWTTWVSVSPDRAARVASRPWTNRVGIGLAIAWPIQCGVGLVVIS